MFFSSRYHTEVSKGKQLCRYVYFIYKHSDNCIIINHRENTQLVLLNIRGLAGKGNPFCYTPEYKVRTNLLDSHLLVLVTFCQQLKMGDKSQTIQLFVCHSDSLSTECMNDTVISFFPSVVTVKDADMQILLQKFATSNLYLFLYCYWNSYAGGYHICLQVPSEVSELKSTLNSLYSQQCPHPTVCLNPGLSCSTVVMTSNSNTFH